MKLKRFNIEQEQHKLNRKYKLDKNIKKRTVVLSIFILIGSIMLYTYSSFTRTVTVDVMHAKAVALNIVNYYIDNQLSDNAPSKNSGYSAIDIICDNNAVGEWDEDDWDLVVTSSMAKNTCDVYFEIIHSGPTYIAPEIDDTHLGIVYLDPTNLSSDCDETLASENVNSYGTPTGIKSGCMKWYVFDDSGAYYTMILDHNTTPRIKWNDTNSNVIYSSSNIPARLALDVQNWDSSIRLTARLISPEEVFDISDGPSSWNVTDENTWFSFGSKNSTFYTDQTSAQKQEQRKYYWLFDYLYQCEDSGCNTSDNNKYSYYNSSAGVSDDYTYNIWTNGKVTNSPQYVWIIMRKGGLRFNNAFDAGEGIRPVITVSKSLFE